MSAYRTSALVLAVLAVGCGAKSTSSRPAQAVPRAPAVPRVLAPACAPLSLAVGASYVFWAERCAEGDRVRRITLQGGSAETLAAWRAGAVGRIVAIGDDLVFAADDAIWYLPSHSHNPSKLAERGGGVTFRVFDGTLYWFTHAGGIERVINLARGVIVPQFSPPDTATFIVSNAGIWRVANRPSTPEHQPNLRLMRPKRRGGESDIWGGFLINPFVRCGTAVYWVDLHSNRVLRLRDGQDTPEYVTWSIPAAQPPRSSSDSAACDDNGIYWAEESENRILDVTHDGDTKVLVSGERAWHLSLNSKVLCWFSLDEEGSSLVKCLDR